MASYDQRKMASQPDDDAVVINARGHDGSDGRELLTGARVPACGHGHVRIWRVGGQFTVLFAGFDRRRGQSQQHHVTVNCL